MGTLFSGWLAGVELVKFFDLSESVRMKLTASLIQMGSHSPQPKLLGDPVKQRQS